MKLQKTPDKLKLAQFKANHGFSHEDVSKMLDEGQADVTRWAEEGAPNDINQTILAIDLAIGRWRQASGAFSDIDRQLYESQIGQMQRVIGDKQIEFNRYRDECESESIFKIISKRIQRKILWFRLTSPFKNISTRG